MAAQAVVVDGDTLDLGGQKYRLFGIDAPEHAQSCHTPAGGNWACGLAATAEMVRLTANKDVQCDDRGKDGFHRILAVCLANGANLNAAMIDGGFAWAFVKFSDMFVAPEAVARTKRIGVWQAPSEAPWDFRADRWKAAAQAAPNGCAIKGNISTNGHIYHVPWDRDYNRTKVSPEKGERWFCSELEALDAGWRAPLWGTATR